MNNNEVEIERSKAEVVKAMTLNVMIEARRVGINKARTFSIMFYILSIIATMAGVIASVEVLKSSLSVVCAIIIFVSVNIVLASIVKVIAYKYFLDVEVKMYNRAVNSILNSMKNLCE